jgi:hypothetical protein
MHNSLFLRLIQALKFNEKEDAAAISISNSYSAYDKFVAPQTEMSIVLDSYPFIHKELLMTHVPSAAVVDIALFSSEDGQPASAAEAKKIAVFMSHELKSAHWTLIRSREWTMPRDGGAFRKELAALIEWLGGSRIVIGKEIAGLAYTALTKGGFAVFQTDSVSDALFSSIVEDIGKVREESASAPISPVETETQGVYVFDFAKVQRDNPEISSKKALKGFLEGDFLVLDLTAAHFPPWMETFLPQRNLVYSLIKEDSHGKTWRIERRLCQD